MAKIPDKVQITQNEVVQQSGKKYLLPAMTQDDYVQIEDDTIISGVTTVGILDNELKDLPVVYIKTEFKYESILGINNYLPIENDTFTLISSGTPASNQKLLSDILYHIDDYTPTTNDTITINEVNNNNVTKFTVNGTNVYELIHDLKLEEKTLAYTLEADDIIIVNSTYTYNNNQLVEFTVGSKKHYGTFSITGYSPDKGDRIRVLSNSSFLINGVTYNESSVSAEATTITKIIKSDGTEIIANKETNYRNEYLTTIVVYSIPFKYNGKILYTLSDVVVYFVRNNVYTVNKQQEVDSELLFANNIMIDDNSYTLISRYNSTTNENLLIPDYRAFKDFEFAALNGEAILALEGYYTNDGAPQKFKGNSAIGNFNTYDYEIYFKVSLFKHSDTNYFLQMLIPLQTAKILATGSGYIVDDDAADFADPDNTMSGFTAESTSGSVIAPVDTDVLLFPFIISYVDTDIIMVDAMFCSGTSNTNDSFSEYDNTQAYICKHGVILQMPSTQLIPTQRPYIFFQGWIQGDIALRKRINSTWVNNVSSGDVKSCIASMSFTGRGSTGGLYFTVDNVQT